MKCMFLCKRGRPDIEPGVCFLSTRTEISTEQDWSKLVRLLIFLRWTKGDILTLEADDTKNLYWYIDAAFAVHQDMKSHTGSTFTMGKGSIISASTKQKRNARSLTESDLNGTDERISKIVWAKRFLENLGYPVKLNVILQDNTSTIKLLKIGKECSGKRTRHFDIRLFYITDLIAASEVSVEYCPTEKMLVNYMSKPLVGKKKKNFRARILNLNNEHHSQIGQQECVGHSDKAVTFNA